MKNDQIVAALRVAGTKAHAEEPCNLGLESANRTDCFYSAFQEIAGPGPEWRGIKKRDGHKRYQP